MRRSPKQTSAALLETARIHCDLGLGRQPATRGQDYMACLVTAVWIYDIENYCIIWANRSALALWESESLEELKSRDFRDGASDAVQQTLKDYQQIFKSGKSLSRIWRYSPKGILKEAYCHLSGYTLEDGRIALLTEAIPVDLIDNNSAASSVITLSTYDNNGQFISGNPPFLETQDHSYSHLKSLFSHADDYQKVRNIVEHTGRFEGDIQIIVNQQVLWHRLVVSTCQHDNLEDSLLVQQFNIDEMKRKELALNQDVITDPLTGLLNRRGLKSLVSSHNTFVIFYLDLDGFKLINDSLGHAVGDQVLRNIGTRLTSEPFEKGHACRFGGDEFIWIADPSALDCGIEQTASQLIQSMNKPYLDSDNRPVTVSASVGIAHYSGNGDDFEEAIIKADAAMYLAKKQGKHCWVHYVSGMENASHRKSQVAQSLYKAIEQGEFQLYYQPIFNLKTKSIQAFEALLRWDSVDIGSVPPLDCIRVAEEIGVIAEIETWVISRALNDLKVLRCLFSDNVTMGVNISSQYFANPACVNTIVDALEKYDLPGSALAIDVNEGTLRCDLEQDNKVASHLHEKGINISIDDFGVGYSLLPYLHQIPATYVKIDHLLTQRVEQDPAVLAGLQQLIESLTLKAIAEGVETKKQSDMLKDIGIFLQQGHGLGSPRPLAFYQQSDSVQQLAGFQS